MYFVYSAKIHLKNKYNALNAVIRQLEQGIFGNWRKSTMLSLFLSLSLSLSLSIEEEEEEEEEEELNKLGFQYKFYPRISIDFY